MCLVFTSAGRSRAPRQMLQSSIGGMNWRKLSRADRWRRLRSRRNRPQVARSNTVCSRAGCRMRHHTSQIMRRAGLVGLRMPIAHASSVIDDTPSTLGSSRPGKTRRRSANIARNSPGLGARAKLTNHQSADRRAGRGRSLNLRRTQAP